MRDVLLILSLLHLHFGFAQINWQDFESHKLYTVDDGLSTNFLNGVYESQDGFLWIISENGLVRFDGTQFNNYEYFQDKDVARRIGNVKKLVFDNNQDRIFLTSSWGVITSRLDNLEFKRSAFGLTDVIDRYDAKSLYVDHNNYLWIGSHENGLIKGDLKTNEQKFFRINKAANTDQSALLSLDKITLDPVNEHILWIGTDSGLIQFDTTSETYNYYQFPTELDQVSKCTSLMATHNAVYLGTFKNGWYEFDKGTKEFKQPITKNHPFFAEHVIDFFKDNDDKIWISSPDELLQYDLNNQEPIQFYKQFEDGDIQLGLDLVDSRGILWDANDHGLNRYVPNSYKKFKYWTPNKSNNSGNLTLNILKVEENYYICPYLGKGIFKLNLSNDSLITIPITQFNFVREEYYRFRDMIITPEKNLVVLSDNRLAIINTSTDKSIDPPSQLPDSTMVYRGSIELDKNNNYWVATHQDGLYKLNFDNGSVENITEIFQGINVRNHEYIKTLFVDSKNRLWIGQDATSVMDLQTRTIECLNPELNYDNLKIYGDFFEDRMGRIWVANVVDGISYVNEKNGKNILEKVIEGSFYGLYEYTDDLIWTLGEDGLGILNINEMTHRIINISSERDFTGPIIKMGDGEYMIGCFNGVFMYNPDKHIQGFKNSIPYVSEIIANGKNEYRGADIDRQIFSLPSGTRSVNIKFGNLNFNDESILLQYKLDEDWADMSSNHQIILSNLRQGEYQLSIKPISTLDISLEPVNFQFTVEPFWYTTKMAYSVYALLTVLLFYFIYKYDLNRRLAILDSKRVREVDELKSKMFANTSHEFRTPLTLIKGLTGMLKKQNNIKLISELANGIEQNSDHLLSMVNQMLDLSALDAGKLEVIYKNGDVVKFIKKCVDLYRSFCESKMQRLTFSANVDSLLMDFDDDKLQKILNNLLSNAIKFTPKGGTIRVKLDQQDKLLNIAVSDSGKGITKNELPHLFDRYYKTKDSYGIKGSGIGLALTKELVELLGGHITVNSKPNTGTKFQVCLPITNNSTQTVVNHQIPFLREETSKKIIETSKPSREAPTILVVEDNQDIQRFINELLSSKYHIVSAYNGTEALKEASEKDVDFIISDVMMPEMDGYEFCKKIKSELATSHIPFIMLSARTHTSDRQKAYKLGVDAYLTKPFNQEELKLVIENLLNKQKNLREQFTQLLTLRKPDSEFKDVNTLDVELINNLQKLILNSNSKLSADQIAEDLHISRTQLHRKIKALTGIPLTQYANQIRVEKAKHLLTTTQLRVKEIAYEVGFESSSYFNRIFKKETNLTPDIYRNAK